MPDMADISRIMTPGQMERMLAFELAAAHTVAVAEHLTVKSGIDGHSSVSSMFDSQTLRLAQWIVDGTDRDDIGVDVDVDVDVEDDDA